MKVLSWILRIAADVGFLVLVALLGLAKVLLVVLKFLLHFLRTPNGVAMVLVGFAIVCSYKEWILHWVIYFALAVFMLGISFICDAIKSAQEGK